MPFSVVVILAILAPNTQGLSQGNNIRSSYLTTVEGQSLFGHATTTQHVHGLMTCAQRCLSRQGCLSFDFRADNCLCELNNDSCGPIAKCEKLATRHGFVHGYWLSIITIQFVFKTLGAQGPLGPTNTFGYFGTSLEGQVHLIRGIQIWTVPYDGEYFIDAFGASGANGTCVRINCSGWRLGGLGARIAGLFKFKRGQNIKILVGQEGQRTGDFSDRPGGGGGGTFVTLIDNSPLIVAGGGGGGGISLPGNLDGDPGQADQEGSRHGGKAGSAGRKYDTIKGNDSSDILSGTGAGLREDGSTKGTSFVNGGLGGDLASKGGFGGGGFGLLQPGGGGGYSGGGVYGTVGTGAAGGGGSINNGASQINTSGVNKGDGRVVITSMS